MDSVDLSSRKTQAIIVAITAIIITSAFIPGIVDRLSKPQLFLSVDKQYADVGEPLLFTVNIEKSNIPSNDGIKQIIFNFHDGTNNTILTNVNIENPSVFHSFSIEGKYMVSATIITEKGISVLDSVEIVIINRPPQAKISASDLSFEIFENQPIHLSSQQSEDPDNDILTYKWYMGDGNVLTGENIEYAWNYSGVYKVVLYVFDDQGIFDYDTINVKVKNAPPAAAFTVNSTIGENNEIFVSKDELIEFNASETIDTLYDHDHLRYYWDFGDGSYGKGIHVLHKYTQSGTYIVNLIAIDDNFEKSTVSAKVIVQNSPPTVDIINETIPTLKEGESFLFVAKANDTLTDYARMQYLWNFGKTGWIASNTWFNDYRGYVSVIASDTDGASDSDSKYIYVENTAPEIYLHTAYVPLEITLNTSSNDFNSILLSIVSNEQIIKTLTITKDNGSIPFIITHNENMFIDKNWTLNILYNASINDNCTPLSLTIAQENKSLVFQKEIYNNNTNTWLWNISVNELFDSFNVILEGLIFDAGADNVSYSLFNETDLMLQQFVSYSISNGLPFMENSIKISMPFMPGMYYLNATDSDGANSDTFVFEIVNKTNYVDIPNLAPKIDIPIIYNANEGDLLEISASIIDQALYESSNSTTIRWELPNFANVYSELNKSSVKFAINYPGTYLVKVYVYEGNYTSVKGILFDLKNVVPHIEIQENWTGYEGKLTHFDFKLFDTNFDKSHINVFWDFGNIHLIGKSVSVEFQNEGIYKGVVTATDDSGISVSRTIYVNIANVKPSLKITNKFDDFSSSPTKIITIEPIDSTYDEINLRWDIIVKSNSSTYTYNTLTSIPIPSDEGNVSLEILMRDTNTTYKYTDFISFYKAMPKITLNNINFYGSPGSIYVIASVFDTLHDYSKMNIKWELSYTNETVITKISDTLLNGLTAINITFDSDGLYILTLTVYANGYQYSKSIPVNVILDSDGDGIPNKFEDTLDSQSSDTDGDMIIDSLELEHGTDPTNPDTDGDGLWDGINPSLGYGELSFGTDPTKPDTDGDGLSDYFEIAGYNITIISQMGNEASNSTVFVHSNPLLIDTDHDGLNDTMEYHLRSNPSSNDTDSDGLPDLFEYNEKIALNNYDTDGDKLPDGYEIDYDPQTGNISYVSDPTKIDSDNDGLSDYEEVNKGQDGYITDPLNNDTDGDGLLDSKEIYIRKITQKQYILYENTSILHYNTNYEVIHKYEIFSYIKSSYVDRKTSKNTSLLLIIQGIPENELLRVTLKSSDFKIELNYIGKSDGLFTKLILFNNSIDGSDLIYLNASILTNSTVPISLREMSLKFTFRSSPVLNDSDFDGLSDYEEIKGIYQFNGNNYTFAPTNPSTKDSDNDGLTDYYEILHNLNPMSADTDGDLVSDDVDYYPNQNYMLKVKIYYISFPNYQQKYLYSGIDSSQKVLLSILISSFNDHYISPIFEGNSSTNEDTVAFNQPLIYYLDPFDSNSSFPIFISIYEARLKDIVHMVILSKYIQQNSSIYIDDYVFIKFAPVRCNKSSVITVYDDTLFENNHYKELNKFYILYLHLNESINATIYENEFHLNTGINTVLIPESIFLRSVLYYNLFHINSASKFYLRNTTLMNLKNHDQLLSYIISIFVIYINSSDISELFTMILRSNNGTKFRIYSTNEFWTLNIPDEIVSVIPWQTLTISPINNKSLEIKSILGVNVNGLSVATLIITTLVLIHILIFIFNIIKEIVSVFIDFVLKNLSNISIVVVDILTPYAKLALKLFLITYSAIKVSIALIFAVVIIGQLHSQLKIISYLIHQISSINIFNYMLSFDGMILSSMFYLTIYYNTIKFKVNVTYNAYIGEKYNELIDMNLPVLYNRIYFKMFRSVYDPINNKNDIYITQFVLNYTYDPGNIDVLFNVTDYNNINTTNVNNFFDGVYAYIDIDSTFLVLLLLSENVFSAKLLIALSMIISEIGLFVYALSINNFEFLLGVAVGFILSVGLVSSKLSNEKYTVALYLLDELKAILSDSLMTILGSASLLNDFFKNIFGTNETVDLIKNIINIKLVIWEFLTGTADHISSIATILRFVKAILVVVFILFISYYYVYVWGAPLSESQNNNTSPLVCNMSSQIELMKLTKPNLS